MSETLKWLEAAPIPDGPLLRPVNRHGKVDVTKTLRKDSIAGIIKGAGDADGHAVEEFAGHQGATERLIMRQDPTPVPNHRVFATSGRTRFRDNAEEKLGLRIL